MVLRKLLESTFGKLSPPVGRVLVCATLAYMMKGMTSADLSKVLRKHLGSRVSVTQYRQELKTGYLLKNIKLWLFWCYKHDLSESECVACASDFLVKKEDHRLAHFICTNSTLRARLKPIRKYKAQTLAKFDRVVSSVIAETDAYTGRFVNRKLRFLQHTGFMCVEDIKLDMTYHGLYGMLAQYPKVDSRLHLVNIYKQSISNAGVNLINYHTTQGRQVLRQEDDGTFSGIKVSLDAIQATDGRAEATVDGGLSYFMDQEAEASCAATKMSVDRLVTEHKGKKRKFLRLLMGTFDHKFSQWLSSIGLSTDNDELFDRHLQRGTIHDYICQVADYLGISQYQAMVFRNSLRARFDV